MRSVRKIVFESLSGRQAVVRGAWVVEMGTVTKR